VWLERTLHAKTSPRERQIIAWFPGGGNVRSGQAQGAGRRAQAARQAAAGASRQQAVARRPLPALSLPGRRQAAAGRP